VHIFRQYRQGDLPDVQIKPSEIIQPLIALSQCDPSLAKIMFSQYFIQSHLQIKANWPDLWMFIDNLTPEQRVTVETLFGQNYPLSIR